MDIFSNDFFKTMISKPYIQGADKKMDPLPEKVTQV